MFFEHRKKTITAANKRILTGCKTTEENPTIQQNTENRQKKTPEEDKTL